MSKKTNIKTNIREALRQLINNGRNAVIVPTINGNDKIVIEVSIRSKTYIKLLVRGKTSNNIKDIKNSISYACGHTYEVNGRRGEVYLVTCESGGETAGNFRAVMTATLQGRCMGLSNRS